MLMYINITPKLITANIMVAVKGDFLRVKVLAITKIKQWLDGAQK